VESHPDHVQSVLLLGVIALLDHDTESLEAVTATLQDLRATHTLTEHEQDQVGEVLRSIAAFSESGPEQAVLTEVQTDIFLHPNQPHGWSHLADVGEDEFAAEIALKTAVKAVPPRGKLDARDLAVAYAGTGKAGDTQTAIFISPWVKGGWDILSGALGSRG